MNKSTLFISALFLITYSKGQVLTIPFTYPKFESQILEYKPKQKENVSAKDFEYGTLILQEVKAAVKKNPKNFNLADYFNVLSVFLTLKEDESNINVAFEKFISTVGSCEYILAFEVEFNRNAKYEMVRKRIMQQLEKCKAAQKYESKFDITEYCKTKHLDSMLVKTINTIDNNDSKYRKDSPVNWAKQTPLDQENQRRVDSLYTVYKEYIGSNLVGAKFESVMWSVIQHSNLKMMEKYLPIIQLASENNNLARAPFKMLIDRFYGLKYGYQLFGTQSGFGFKLADAKTKREVMKKHGITQ